MYVVYSHTRLDTNTIFYIGLGKTKKRAYNKVNRSNHWKRIVNKHGYKVSIIKEFTNYEKASLYEIELISYYGKLCDNTGCLINITNGGEGTLGYKHTYETICKIKNSTKKRGISDELRIKLTKGRRESSYKHSKSIIDKIVESRKGYVHSEETKIKMRNSNKHGFSEKAKKASKLKISIRVIDTVTGQIFESITEAANNSQYSKSTIMRHFKKSNDNINLKKLDNYVYE